MSIRAKSFIVAAAASAFIMPAAFAQQDTMTDQPASSSQQAATETQQPQSQLLGAGVTVRDEVDSESIRELLASVTRGAVEEGGFENVVERMVDQDRNRMGRYLDQARETGMADYNAAVAEFRQNWQDKYGQGFGIENPETTFSSLRATQGEVNDPAAFAQNWPVNAVGGMSAMDSANLAGSTQDEALLANETQSNIEEGREVAVATIGMGDKEINVSLINEFPGVWKIDVPNTMNGQAMSRQLTMQLEKLNQSVADWPEDVAQAQQVVAAHVVAALTGASQQMNGSAQGASSDLDAGNDAQPTNTARDTMEMTEQAAENEDGM